MSTGFRTIRSFKFAFDGLKTALKEEPNLRVHFLLAVLALFLGFVLKLSNLEWLVLILTIGLVLILELINTSVESIVNLVSPQIQNEAKIAKDVSAAAVLMAAILSLTVGAFLFLPKLLQYFL